MSNIGNKYKAFKVYCSGNLFLYICVYFLIIRMEFNSVHSFSIFIYDCVCVVYAFKVLNYWIKMTFVNTKNIDFFEDNIFLNNSLMYDIQEIYN